MKKLLALLLCLMMILSASSALALDFPENLKNEATFETFEEAEASALAYEGLNCWVKALRYISLFVISKNIVGLAINTVSFFVKRHGWLNENTF